MNVVSFFCFLPSPLGLRRSAAIWLVALCGFASLQAAGSEKTITVPGAQRAIEQYQAAIAQAEADYLEAGKRADGRWDETAYLRRATVTYSAAIESATRELTSELKRIEDWLLEQVERIRERREDAETDKAALIRPYLHGKLHVVVKGRADVFLNGALVATMADPDSTHLTSTNVRFRSGDLLLFRVQSPFVYRSFRATIVTEDGETIPVTTTERLHFAGDRGLNPKTMTGEDFDQDWPNARMGRADSGGLDSRWDSLRLKNDQTVWIGLPDNGGPYFYAFLVP